ncbi:hypothetical protein ARMSODRAFT_967408 [Armillaria solidipes]|uniref:Uncharacterized protein n=1 Tax=Armillaria solidipes TaxID=1076256 RepID=A0A2H3AVA5_9AGAR|nr:hypothetical protein ARMSODRAFT_967408 [Armillaria solidipes]
MYSIVSWQSLRLPPPVHGSGTVAGILYGGHASLPIFVIALQYKPYNRELLS